MAELATPAAATMGTMNAGASNDIPKPQPSAKPEKPDEEAFKAAVESARKALKDAQEQSKEAQARVNAARPGNKDSPVSKRQQDLRSQLADIRTKQQGFKTARSNVQDRIKVLDTQLKAKIQEQKTAKSRIPYKNVEEIDNEIQRLDKEVESGRMKLVDEKKALADITNLRKQRKAFSALDDSQKAIDELKSQLAHTKKDLDNPEFKKLSDEYASIQNELDGLKVEQDEAFKGLNASRDAATKAKAHQDEKYAELKKIQDDFYQSKRTYMDYERDAARQRAAKKKAESLAYQQEKKRRALEADMEDAKSPAYLDEINASKNLMRLLDPTSVMVETASGPGKFAAVAQRTIDDSGMKGTKLSKKDDDGEDYFVGSSGKKSKKGQKGRKGGEAVQGETAGPMDIGKFFDPSVVTQFSKVGVEPPTTQAEIPTVLAQIKEKREFWLNDRERKREENISAVQKRIDALATGEDDPDDLGVENLNIDASTQSKAPGNKKGVKKAASVGDEPAAAANPPVNGDSNPREAEENPSADSLEEVNKESDGTVPDNAGEIIYIPLTAQEQHADVNLLERPESAPDTGADDGLRDTGSMKALPSPLSLDGCSDSAHDGQGEDMHSSDPWIRRFLDASDSDDSEWDDSSSDDEFEEDNQPLVNAFGYGREPRAHEGFMALDNAPDNHNKDVDEFRSHFFSSNVDAQSKSSDSLHHFRQTERLRLESDRFPCEDNLGPSRKEVASGKRQRFPGWRPSMPCEQPKEGCLKQLRERKALHHAEHIEYPPAPRKAHCIRKSWARCSKEYYEDTLALGARWCKFRSLSDYAWFPALKTISESCKLRIWNGEQFRFVLLEDRGHQFDLEVERLMSTPGIKIEALIMMNSKVEDVGIS